MLSPEDFGRLRAEMVEEQLAERGIEDEGVLAAMHRVPREAFVHPELMEYAYVDAPLPIGEGQTISQPYMVAFMTEAADVGSNDVVLDVGTGSGYAAAVLAEIADRVYTIERNVALAEIAAGRLRSLGYENVNVRHGDGTLGWPEHAPYNAIVVAASAPDIPKPLLEQLAVGGRLIVPVGKRQQRQLLKRVRRHPNDIYETEHLASVQFVPLVGKAGWQMPPPEE